MSALLMTPLILTVLLLVMVTDGLLLPVGGTDAEGAFVTPPTLTALQVPHLHWLGSNAITAVEGGRGDVDADWE